VIDPCVRPGIVRRALLVACATLSLVGSSTSRAADVAWEPGNGVLLPGGLWVAGDVTVGVEVPEDEPASAGLDDVSLLARWEVQPRFALFTEVRMEDLVEVVEGEGWETGRTEFAIERLYAEILVAPPLTVRLGKVFTPFGLWNVTHRAPYTWTTDEPAVADGLFPTRTTGLSLIYRTTWHGWSFDATAYGPAQDELRLHAPDDDEPDDEGWLAGTRLAAGRAVGSAFATLGLNAAGFRPRDRARWTTATGLDLEIDVGGHHLTGELTFRVPDGPGRTTYGFYAQDAISLAPLGRLARDLYAVVRLEQFQPAHGRSAVGGLVGFYWRPVPALVVRADYLFASRTLDNLEPGFHASLAFLF
jgi:hypothetical protein